jgi:hypothetical protein
MARDTLSIAGIAAHTAPKGLSGFLKWLAHRRKAFRRVTFRDRNAPGYLARGEALQFADAVGSGILVSINEAAHLLRKALAADPRTVELVGGKTWWTLRGSSSCHLSGPERTWVPCSR